MAITRRTFAECIVVSALPILSSCGGDSGGGTSSSNDAPITDADTDFSAIQSTKGFYTGSSNVALEYLNWDTGPAFTDAFIKTGALAPDFDGTSPDIAVFFDETGSQIATIIDVNSGSVSRITYFDDGAVITTSDLSGAIVCVFGVKLVADTYFAGAGPAVEGVSTAELTNLQAVGTQSDAIASYTAAYANANPLIARARVAALPQSFSGTCKGDLALALVGGIIVGLIIGLSGGAAALALAAEVGGATIAGFVAGAAGSVGLGIFAIIACDGETALSELLSVSISTDTTYNIAISGSNDCGEGSAAGLHTGTATDIGGGLFKINEYVLAVPGVITNKVVSRPDAPGITRTQYTATVTSGGIVTVAGRDLYTDSSPQDTCGGSFTASGTIGRAFTAFPLTSPAAGTSVPLLKG